MMVNIIGFKDSMGHRAFAPDEQLLFFSYCLQMSATIDAQ